MNASCFQSVACSSGSNVTSFAAADSVSIQADLIKQARIIDCPMAMADFLVSQSEQLVPFRKAALIVDGVVRSVRSDTPSAHSRRVVRGLESLAVNLVNQRVDAPCVIDQCIDFVKSSSDVVALYDFYSEQMLWIPWMSGSAYNANLRGGMLLERAEAWSTTDIVRLSKLVSVGAQTVSALSIGFPAPVKPANFSHLRRYLLAAVFAFSLSITGLSLAVTDSEAYSPASEQELFSMDETDLDSEFEPYI